MKLKSRFFRIAVAGDTTDGRVIEADWLTQMAANYNPEKYTARINCEHIRSYMPEGPFGMYGSVLALKTEEVEIDGEKAVALFASIEPTPELVQLNKKGQKLFTSMEIDPDFAKKGQFYLSGLAITDSPASLGTEMLEFAAKAATNPFAGRKQKPENLFSAAREADLEFSDDKTLVERVKEMFSKSAADQSSKDAEYTQALEAVAGEVANLQAKVNAFTPGDGKDYSADLAALKQQLDQSNADLAALKGDLAKLPNFSIRPPASGGNGAVQTDC